MAIGTFVLAIIAFVQIMANVRARKHDRRNQLLHEFIRWASDAMVCGFDSQDATVYTITELPERERAQRNLDLYSVARVWGRRDAMISLSRSFPQDLQEVTNALAESLQRLLDLCTQDLIPHRISPVSLAEARDKVRLSANDVVAKAVEYVFKT